MWNNTSRGAVNKSGHWLPVQFENDYKSIQRDPECQMISGCWKTLIPGCSKRSRCEAREKSTSGGVFTDTLERGDRAQRSRWAFFNSL